MSGKDAGLAPRPVSHTLRRCFAILGGATGLLALLLAGRMLGRPGAAVAQAPNKGFKPPLSAPGTRPAAGSKAPATGARTAALPPAGPARTAAEPNAATEVMASVNGQPITREELGRECLRRYGKEILENMVNRQLIWQGCQQQNIQITEQDVEQEIESIARKFGLDKNRWIQLLQDERDVSPDQYRREIVWPTLALRRLAAKDIDVTPEELRRAFESEFGPSVKVRMIALDQRKEAEQVRAKALAAPESFGDLAKEHSKDPNSASVRGLIPPIRRHVGDPHLENVAFKLKKGEISPIIEVADQFIILRCEDHLPEKYVDSKKVAQVQEQVKDRIRDDKLREAAGNMFRRLQEQSQVTNVMNNPALQAQHPGVAALLNGRPIMLADVASDCLARHGKSVLDGEINRLILTQELQRRNQGVTDQDIDQEITRAAESYGYVKNGAPDVDGWLKAVTDEDKVSVDLYVRDAVWPSVALKKLVSGQVKISEDDLKKGFEANYGERVEVMAIGLSNQRQAQQVWEQARNNPTDQFFGELAQQHSVEPMSRANSGRVPPIRRHGGQPVMEEEAFRLKAGEQSGIIAMADKYVILRCLGRTKPVVQEYAAVREELYKDLHEKKLRIEMAKTFDELKEKARVDNRLAGTVSLGVRPNGPARGDVVPAAPVAGAAPVQGPRSGLQPASATRPVEPARSAPPRR